jgi:hypothetical protein
MLYCLSKKTYRQQQGEIYPHLQRHHGETEALFTGSESEYNATAREVICALWQREHAQAASFLQCVQVVTVCDYLDLLGSVKRGRPGDTRTFA